MALLIMIIMMTTVIGRSTSDSNFTEDGVSVEVLGQSGKIIIKNDNNSAMVTFDYIKELDNSGSEIGKTGRKKHSINTFARESFTFKTSGLDTSYQNLSVKHIQFSATISGPGAVLTVDIYLFKEAGNVTAGNETTEVKEGSVKFNINISSWTFCGGSGGDSCRKGSSSETGTQLEFGIEIKGKGSPKKKMQKRGQGSKLETFDIGGADCTLSGMIKTDDVWGEMPGDYPKSVMKGSKTLFVFRFPRFSNNVLYDPTVDLSSSSSSSDSSTTVQPMTSDSGVQPTNPPTTPKGGSVNNKAPFSLVFLCALGFFLKLFA